MYTQLDDGQYMYCAQDTVSLMPTVALLFDRHSGRLLAHGVPARVYGRYEQLAESARRAGHPELEQCMVYWEGQFDPNDLNQVLTNPAYLKQWHDRCAMQAEAVTRVLLARADTLARQSLRAQPR